jgi:hypothetical protein
VRRSLRVLASLATLAFLVGVPAPAALAAGPERFVIDLDDPQVDAEEAEFWSGECGFEVAVDNRGHIMGAIFPAGHRSVVELDHYLIRASYTNVETGTVVRLRDIGPDRFYLRAGRAYVAVTGRSLTGTGTIGQVVFDLETNEIVHQAGRETGLFQDQLCDALAG